MAIIRADRAVLDGALVDNAWIRIEGEHISDTGVGNPPAMPDIDSPGLLLPGFVDQHCHGGSGSNFFAGDTEEARVAADLHLSHGTTTIVASLVTAAPQQLLEQVQSLVPLVADGILAGIHLEGPWISEHMCGAHDPLLLRDPDPAEISRVLEVGQGKIVMATIAPERLGAIEAIRQLVAADVIAAIGHTASDYSKTQEAIDAGATVATHLFNRMPHVDHRDPGPIVALMSDSRVFVELIADGVHLNPALIAFVVQTVGPERALAITDAMGAAGSPDGDYVIGELEVEVVNGIARLKGNGALAGSTLTMDFAVKLLVEECGLDLAMVSEMVSGTSAKAMGFTDRGRLKPGYRADIAILNDSLEVSGVIQAGDVLSPELMRS